LDPTDINKYATVMREIKLRTEVIMLFLSGQREARYVRTTVETIGLQLRKIFELIAFASLAANRTEYSQGYGHFAKHWEAAKLLKNLRKTNPNFYPRPVVEEPTDQLGVRHALKERGPDYLTQDVLIEAHGRCGSLMHSANPFGQQIDYGYYLERFPVWMHRVINLLNNLE
jgi:hypothetical protein